MRGLLVAVRPMYLGGGLLLFVLGAAIAGKPYLAGPIARGLVVVLLVHVITHYVNDAEDVVTDAQSVPTAFTGGSRAIQRGLTTPAALLRASAWLAAIVATIALFELSRGDTLAAALDLAILFFGYAYSGRPFALGRRGMSELDAALVMGVLVPLLGAHAAGGIDRAAGSAAAVLFVETVFARLCTAYPDLDADRATGKRTIPAIVGARGTIVVFVIVGVLIAATGLLLAPLLPSPDVQRARAIVVAGFAFVGALVMATGVAQRRRALMPILGILGYATSQATLLATALMR